MTPEKKVSGCFIIKLGPMRQTMKSKKRRPCMSKDCPCLSDHCGDDFGETLGYVATDTFSFAVENQKVTGVQFEGDDPPIFMKLFEWISINRAEIMSGPCLNMFAGGHTQRLLVAELARLAILFLRGSQRANPVSEVGDYLSLLKKGESLWKIHRRRSKAPFRLPIVTIALGLLCRSLCF